MIQLSNLQASGAENAQETAIPAALADGGFEALLREGEARGARPGGKVLPETGKALPGLPAEATSSTDAAIPVEAGAAALARRLRAGLPAREAVPLPGAGTADPASQAEGAPAAGMARLPLAEAAATPTDLPGSGDSPPPETLAGLPAAAEQAIADSALVRPAAEGGVEGTREVQPARPGHPGLRPAGEELAEPASPDGLAASMPHGPAEDDAPAMPVGDDPETAAEAIGEPGELVQAPVQAPGSRPGPVDGEPPLQQARARRFAAAGARDTSPRMAPHEPRGPAASAERSDAVRGKSAPEPAAREGTLPVQSAQRRPVQEAGTRHLSEASPADPAPGQRIGPKPQGAAAGWFRIDLPGLAQAGRGRPVSREVSLSASEARPPRQLPVRPLAQQPATASAPAAPHGSDEPASSQPAGETPVRDAARILDLSPRPGQERRAAAGPGMPELQGARPSIAPLLPASQPPSQAAAPATFSFIPFDPGAGGLTGAQPAAAGAAREGFRPHEFSALVDRLVEARESARGATLQMSVLNRDFGHVSLRFAQDSGGLAVSLSNSDPDFARTVQAALPGGEPRDGNASAQGDRREFAGSSHSGRMSADGQDAAGGQSARRDRSGENAGHGPAVTELRMAGRKHRNHARQAMGGILA